MDLLIGVLIFTFGFLAGEFMYLCITRIPKEDKVINKPYIIKNKKSMIFSYIIGILTVVIYLKYNVSLLTIKYLMLMYIITVIGIIDYKTTDVYFKTTLPGIIVGLVFILIGTYYSISPTEYILSGLVAGGTIAITHYISKGGIGGGDAEAFLICGLFLGIEKTIIVTLLSFTIATILGLSLVLLKRRKFKDSMPFIPFIAVTSISAILIF